MLRTLVVLALAVLTAPARAQQPTPSEPSRSAPTLPGRRPDGTTLLPNGWSLAPHGRSIPLASDLPVRIAWRPGNRPGNSNRGDLLAVQHAGYRDHRVELVRPFAPPSAESTDAVRATLDLPKTWSGLSWSVDGERLFASGGVDDVVHVFAVAGSGESAERTAAWPIGDPGRLDLPAGMCAVDDGGLWLCLQRTDRLVRLDADGGTVVSVALPAGSMPFTCVLSPDGSRVFVSLWGAASVVAVDADTGAPLAKLPAGEHPSEMAVSPDGGRLFVSNANENTVTVVDARRLRVEETIGSALFPDAPPGSTPNSVSLDPRGKLLLIANADNNNCAVVDVSTRGRSRNLGFVPLGWYPTQIAWSRDGARVVAANGKGVASAPNPDGPQPGQKKPDGVEEYIGGLFTGSLSVFDFPSPDELAHLSQRAYACAPLQRSAAVRGTETRPADSPIPAKVGDPSPITHCVYIIKENRTYDQIFGDIERGNGDEELCLFPRKVTPNHHAITDEFVLLDNFYVESEVSADGHEWTMGAYATDFVERTWPVTYGGKGNGKGGGLGYPSEGAFDIATPKGGYLFDRAAAAGVTFRSYGEFVTFGTAPGPDTKGTIPVLDGHIDQYYPGYDLSKTDVSRAERFLVELAEFEQRGSMPRLVVMRLPNDHTAGARAGMPTPRAMVADNDLALGKVLEGLSKSRFWKSMAVFVVQDDAQNGPDHVDAHRTVAMVAGPHVRRGGDTVSTMYSTASMLRTMELILGMAPMSQFDAAARPMYDCFVATPDPRPYACRAATWPLDERNQKTSWGAELSERMNLAREDAADDLLLNEVVWKSVKGADSEMPMPRRAAFVRVLEDDEDDDD